jgi:L-lactate dehydrogenase complex protein LldE
VDLAQRIDQLMPRVFELSEFLTQRIAVEDVGASFPRRVAYHPTCHSLRGLKLGDGPLRLLQKVRGLELVGLPGAEVCCGFGGTFAVKNRAVSEAMGADKVDAVIASGADVCTAVDTSCLMQIEGALRRRRAAVRTVHLAEILDASDG